MSTAFEFKLTFSRARFLVAGLLFGSTLMLAPPVDAANSQSVDEKSVDQSEPMRPVPVIKWDTTLSKFQFDHDKFIGQRLTVRCPAAPSGQSLDSIFGTDHYPTQMPICLAAMHAGVIDQKGGIVTIQLNPGRDAYQGSSRNGIDSGDLPKTDRSFSFVGGPGEEETNRIHLEHLPQIDWDTNFTRTGFANRNLVGQRFTFRLGSMPLDRRLRVVYGTDAYAFDSKVGWAAMHAGKLTSEGGVVTVQINDRTDELIGSHRNGVTTRGKKKTDITLVMVDNPVAQQEAQPATPEKSNTDG